MSIELEKQIRATSNARMRTKLLAVSHFIDGKSRYQIADFLKVSRTSVNKWISTYLREGVDGLVEKKHTGRPQQLNKEQLDQLKTYITDNAVKPQGGRLQGTDIIAYIENKFSISYSLSGVYLLLKRLKLVWITTRSKHPKQSIEAQEDFKKTPNRNDP